MFIKVNEKTLAGDFVIFEKRSELLQCNLKRRLRLAFISKNAGAY